MNLLCGSRVSARPFTARDARECRRRRGWQGDVRLIGLLGGKRQSKKRDRREGRGGARLARFLRRGHPAVLSPFAGACGRWRRQPGHPILRVSPRPIRSGRHHRFGFSASGSGWGLLVLCRITMKVTVTRTAEARRAVVYIGGGSITFYYSGLRSL
jgi:hypothetical protein